jgi:hypothetical protein
MTQLRKDGEGKGVSFERSPSSTEPKLDSDPQVSQPIAELNISPKRLIKQCLVIIVGLAILSTLGQISRHIYGYGSLLGGVDLFYVDAEANIPTAYSSFIWVLCSFASAIIALSKKQMGDRSSKYWQGFALTFAYLALDEVAAIHELFLSLRRVWNLGGVFYFIWIIPGSLFVLFFVVKYFGFLKTLPTKTRTLMILAGGIFVMGAIGVEMIGGWYTEAFGFQADLTYALIATTEEILEMIGVLMLLYALLSYMGKYLQPFQIRVLSR